MIVSTHSRIARWAAAIVRDRGDVLDGADFQTNRLQGADGGFPAGTRAFDADFHFFHAMSHRLAGSVLRDHLRGVSRALAGAFETHTTGAGPADEVALSVRDGDLGVVEGGKNIRDGNAAEVADAVRRLIELRSETTIRLGMAGDSSDTKTSPKNRV